MEWKGQKDAKKLVNITEMWKESESKEWQESELRKKKLRIGEVESESKNGKRKWTYRSEKESESKVWKKTMTKRKRKANIENERLNREEDITW